jgi:hypothetical protein
MSSAPIDGLAASKRTARCSRYGVSVVRVSVVKITVGVENVRVVDVGVADIDPIHIPISPVIPGMERFAISQREPADSETDAKSEAEASAEKPNERRTID